MRLDLGDRVEEGSLILTPFIDVMLFLLVFFLAATTFAKSEVEMSLNLPEASKGRPAEEARQIIINVAADGTIHMDGQRVTLEGLMQKLRAIAGRKRDQPVLIRGDTDVRFGAVTAVFDACLAASLKAVSIGARPKAVPEGQPR